MRQTSSFTIERLTVAMVIRRKQHLDIGLVVSLVTVEAQWRHFRPNTQRTRNDAVGVLLGECVGWVFGDFVAKVWMWPLRTYNKSNICLP